MIRFHPSHYLDFEGFSSAIQISLINNLEDDHIIYAYNNSFALLYGSPSIDKTFQLNIENFTESCKSL